MTFHFFFLCFCLVNILPGNPSTCGSKFLRMQHCVPFHAQTFLESRPSSKLKDFTISEKNYVTWLSLNLQPSLKSGSKLWNFILSFHVLALSIYSLGIPKHADPNSGGYNFLREKAMLLVACLGILGTQIFFSHH